MGHTVSREELKEKIQTNLGIYFYYPHFFKSVKEGNLCTCAVSNQEKLLIIEMVAINLNTIFHFKRSPYLNEQKKKKCFALIPEPLR